MRLIGRILPLILLLALPASAQYRFENWTTETRTVFTNQFGYYRFDEVAAGETYIFEARHKRYLFAPQVFFVTEETAKLNFTVIAVQKILF